jgi:ribonuclease HII
MDDINMQKQNSQECTKEPKKRIREKQLPLSKSFTNDMNIIEIGVDEVGRGPLFGRVYVAAVILPKDDSFDHSKMKDSKKFHSKKKIEEVSEYIKKSAFAWAICYEDEKVIDEINILQATQRAMHKCIAEILKKDKLLFDDGYATDNINKKIQ